MKILSSEITPEKIYKNRRKFIKQLGLTSSVFYLVPGLLNNAQASNKLTDYNYVTTYNNYYEFGTGKSDPAVYQLKPFNLKILKADVQQYIESDEEWIKANQKVKYLETIVDFLDRTLRQITNRTFTIKNAIDWRKFTSGAI